MVIRQVLVPGMVIRQVAWYECNMKTIYRANVAKKHLPGRNINVAKKHLPGRKINAKNYVVDTR